jgi:RNA polymerase sigma-70 factor (ECF subfamily)
MQNRQILQVPYMQSIDEQTAISQARRGEINAFNQLVLAYQGMAYSVAYRMLQDEAAAADVVQESFFKAYRALHGFQGGNFKSWLMRIVVNSCYDVLRIRQRYNSQSLDDPNVEPDYADQLVDHAESPESYAERMELNELLEVGMRSLPPDQRTVLVLCDVQGHSYEEIADITGFAMGTVKSRISRARSKLRNFLLQRSELLPTTFRP